MHHNILLSARLTRTKARLGSTAPHTTLCPSLSYLSGRQRDFPRIAHAIARLRLRVRDNNHSRHRSARRVPYRISRSIRAFVGGADILPRKRSARCVRMRLTASRRKPRAPHLSQILLPSESGRTDDRIVAFEDGRKIETEIYTPRRTSRPRRDIRGATYDRNSRKGCTVGRRLHNTYVCT